MVRYIWRGVDYLKITNETKFIKQLFIEIKYLKFLK